MQPTCPGAPGPRPPAGSAGSSDRERERAGAKTKEREREGNSSVLWLGGPVKLFQHGYPFCSWVVVVGTRKPRP